VKTRFKTVLIPLLSMCTAAALGLVPVHAQAPAPAGRGEPQQAQKTSAPAPRMPDTPEMGVQRAKPDFGGKGMWRVPYVVDMAQARAGVEKPTDVPFLPWSKIAFDEATENHSKDDPEGYCLPPGVPRMMFTPYPMEIVQLPNRIVMIYEGGAHVWRIIWMDGRKHPQDPNPTFLGDAIGRWDRDTLVLDTVGFNDRTWLDAAGHRHTEQLHVTEKYSRPNLDTLHYETTIDDPGAYSKPWTVTMNIPWAAGQELMEYICQENNRDVQHLVGK
jgi:hypothetical protein